MKKFIITSAIALSTLFVVAQTAPTGTEKKTVKTEKPAEKKAVKKAVKPAEKKVVKTDKKA